MLHLELLHWYHNVHLELLRCLWVEKHHFGFFVCLIYASLFMSWWGVIFCMSYLCFVVYELMRCNVFHFGLFMSWFTSMLHYDLLWVVYELKNITLGCLWVNEVVFCLCFCYHCCFYCLFMFVFGFWELSVAANIYTFQHFLASKFFLPTHSKYL